MRVATRVQADYDADPEMVLTLLTEAVRGVPRLLADPAPSAFLVAFADSGVEYEVAGFIADPQNGKLGVQSEMNRAIWKAFRANGISIPYPQRELRVLPQSGTLTTTPVSTVAANAAESA